MRKLAVFALATLALGGVAFGQANMAPQMVPGSDYETSTGPDRASFAISKNRRGETEPIPISTVSRLCGDQDGCKVRLGMHNWDDTGRVASRETLLYYNRQNRAWRASVGDPSGTDSNNDVQHVLYEWSCYLTDGEYRNFNGTDSAAGFGLLSWRQYNADCWVTLID